MTDRRRHGLTVGDLLARIRDLAEAGIDAVQIRERDLSDRELFALATSAVAASRRTPTVVLVNDRTDVAIAAGAAGVHLRGDSPPASRVRAVAPRGFLIGRSVHALDEAIGVAREDVCDYLLLGTVFPSTGKAGHHTLAGLGMLGDVCRAVSVPVLAIGGINPGNVQPVAASGAAGIAAVDAFFAGPRDTLRADLAAIRRAFDTGSQVV